MSAADPVLPSNGVSGRIRDSLPACVGCGVSIPSAALPPVVAFYHVQRGLGCGLGCGWCRALVRATTAALLVRECKGRSPVDVGSALRPQEPCRLDDSLFRLSLHCQAPLLGGAPLERSPVEVHSPK